VNDLSGRARTKKLLPDEVQGGTFTITNPGIFGNLFGFPIINQPQVAILGVGENKKRPVVIDDAIAIRSMVYISMSYDHRIIDGALGGKFLQRIVQDLENFDTNRSI
jgi:2-oxoglutarate dehydrogenase E2 component (dihydrolipoamide succinyltransferase)